MRGKSAMQHITMAALGMLFGARPETPKRRPTAEEVPLILAAMEKHGIPEADRPALLERIRVDVSADERTRLVGTVESTPQEETWERDTAERPYPEIPDPVSVELQAERAERKRIQFLKQKKAR